MNEIRDSERGLWGNGTLTIMARLSSVIAAFLMALLLWVAREVWADVQILKDDKIELARSFAQLHAKLDEHSRWNATQDLRIDRLLDRERINNHVPR